MTGMSILDFLNTTSESEKELFKTSLKTLNIQQKNQTPQGKVNYLANTLLERSSNESKYIFVALVNCLNSLGDYSNEITPNMIANKLKENNTEQLLHFLTSTSKNESLPDSVINIIEVLQNKPLVELKKHHQLLLEKINSYI